MPEVRAPKGHAQAQIYLVRCLCILSAIATFLTWSFDHAQGLNTPWDDAGAPILGVIYALAALLLYWREDWQDAIVVGALLPTSVYYLGVLYYTSQNPSSAGLYALAAHAQYMPLYYLGAFVALRRYAAWVCWLNYAGIAGLYFFRYGFPMGQVENAHAHVWATLLIAHPCYIVALHYISSLKGRLRNAELASHQSKERFLAMLSHEIRSPLQAMLGSIDLLALKARTPPELRAVDRIRTAAGQLDTHLRDVTEYTRLEHPNWRMSPQTVDLPLLVRDVCASFQVKAQEKSLELVCQSDPSDSPQLAMVLTDPARLRQILCNLISNAIKYTNLGCVTVSMELDEPGQCVHMAVSDTGIGIEAQEQQRIFEPYVRLEDRRSQAPSEGSGLGLAVVSRLVERLGGELQLRSKPDHGSTFTVTLPLRARPLQA